MSGSVTAIAFNCVAIHSSNNDWFRRTFVVDGSRFLSVNIDGRAKTFGFVAGKGGVFNAAKLNLHF